MANLRLSTIPFYTDVQKREILKSYIDVHDEFTGIVDLLEMMGQYSGTDNKEYFNYTQDKVFQSATVTGSGGGGTHVYHWKENRALTNRERARLQTFPDSFVFEGSKESVRKQIGMAVPVKGAKIIFDSILKTFAGIDYPSQDKNVY